ncbi:MAG: SDR family oxidoreductase [Pseudomonadota bacterium]
MKRTGHGGDALAKDLQRTVLITGASSGIGAALAREFAARGNHLVLVARRRDRLQTIADELKDYYGCRCIVAPADLSVPETPAAISDALTASGVEIDVLVNNAGYGIPGAFLSVDWERQAAMLQVMITAVAELTHRFLPAMVARGSGQILNVASVAGFMPGTAGHTLYGPIKAWMIPFTQAIAAEYGDQGIRATAVCPGFTRSEFHDVSGTRGLVADMPGYMWMNADQVAETAVDALERGDTVYVPGRFNRLLSWCARHAPRRILDRVADRQARRIQNAD